MAEPVVSPSSTIQQDSTTNLPTPQKQTSGAAWTAEQGNIAAARNVDSPTNAYVPGRNETNATILQTTAAAITLGAGAANDTHLHGLHIHTALAGTMTVAVLLDDTGGARSYVFPIGTVGHLPFYGAKNGAGFWPQPQPPRPRVRAVSGM